MMIIRIGALVSIAWTFLGFGFFRSTAAEPATTNERLRAVAIERGDWPMYNHDPSGWRFNPAEKTLSPANVGKLVEKWRFPAADSKETIGVVHATPTVVGGEVYFGTVTDPAFYKLAPDGTLLWTYRNTATNDNRLSPPKTAGTPDDDKLREAARGRGIFSSALVAGGAVYFGDNGGWIYCLDAAEGVERWKVDTRDPAFPDAHWNNLLNEHKKRTQRLAIE